MAHLKHGIASLFLAFTTFACGDSPVSEAVPVPEYYRATHREWRTTIVEGREFKYEVADGEVVTEGDITWGSVQEFEARLASKQALGVFKDGGRWSMPVKYSFDNDMPSSAKDAVRAAMNKLVQESGAIISFDTCSTCLSAHIKFVYNGNGCSSPIGRQFSINKVNLDTWCDDTAELGSIMHEIMHSLGVQHEQSRCDRNSYVAINYANIEDGESGNFDSECSNNTDHGAYDYGSVMHYSPYAFSRNGLKTIAAWDPSKESLMGQRSALSAGDAAALRAMYGSRSSGGGGGGVYCAAGTGSGNTGEVSANLIAPIEPCL
jgi:hypothetical protein